MAALETSGMGIYGSAGDESGALSGLRERKLQLEQKMAHMQQQRRHLMNQLEQLMLSIKVPSSCIGRPILLLMHRKARSVTCT